MGYCLSERLKGPISGCGSRNSDKGSNSSSISGIWHSQLIISMATNFLTDVELERTADVPVSLPLTRLNSGDWLIVATVQIRTGQEFRFNTLNLQVAGAFVNGAALPLNDQCNPVSLLKINASYGLVYVGIAKDYSSSDDPSGITWQGTASDVVSAPSAGTYVRNPTSTTLSISTPGTYSFVVVNNSATTSTDPALTAKVDANVCVSGQIRIRTG